MAPASAGAILVTKPNSDLSVDLYRLSRSGRCLGISCARLADVDAALEECAILDRDARRDHIASQRTFAADIHTIARLAVSANLAEHNDFASDDVRRNLAIAAYGNAIAGKIDCTFDFAVDVQRLRTGELTLDD